MNTNRISLSALSPDLRNKLLSGKVLIPTALVAVGAFTFLSANEVVNTKIADTPSSDENNASVEFKSNFLFSTADHNMSFNDAFHTQREALGPGGVFEYKSKYYNTFLIEEWDLMSEEQKKDYYASIHKNIDSQSIVHHDVHGNSTFVKIDVTIEKESGDITVTSLTPNVNMESVTVNTGGSKQNEPTPLDPTPEIPTPDIPNETDSIVDPSEIEMEAPDNIDEPSAEIVQEDNITDPSEIEIDDEPVSSLSVTEETDDPQVPEAENSMQTLVDNAVSLPDDITIDIADFDF